MSRSAEDKIPELQSSFVAAFLKQKLGKDALVSTNFRKEYSKCLSLFLFYLSTIAKHNLGDSKKKLTKACILKALSDIGFEDFAEQLGELQIDFKQSNGSSNQKQAKKPASTIKATTANQGENAEAATERMDEDLQNMNLQAVESEGRVAQLGEENEIDYEDEEDNVPSDEEDEEQQNITNNQNENLEVEESVVAENPNHTNTATTTMDQIIGQTSTAQNVKPYEELF